MKRNHILLLIPMLVGSILCACGGNVDEEISKDYLLDKAVWNWTETNSGFTATVKVPTSPDVYTKFNTYITKEELVPATCTSNGITRYIASASVDGIVITSHKDVTEMAKGHNYTSYIVDDEKHSLRCDCGYTKVGEPHTFGNETIIESPDSYKTPGYTQRVCTVCGYKKISPITSDELYFSKKVEKLNEQLAKFPSLPEAMNIYEYLDDINHTNSLFDLFTLEEINKLPKETKTKFLSIVSCYGTLIDCSKNSPFNINLNFEEDSNFSFEIKASQYDDNYGCYSDIKLLDNWNNTSVSAATAAEVMKVDSDYDKATLRIRTVDPTYEIQGKTRYTFFTMPTNVKFNEFVKEIGFSIYAPIDGTRLAFQSLFNDKMSSTRTYLTLNPQSFADTADVTSQTINGNQVGQNNISYKTSFIKKNSNQYEIRSNDDNNNPLFKTPNFYDAIVLMDNLAKAYTQEIKLNKGWNNIVLDQNVIKQLIGKDIFRMLFELRNDNSIPKTVGDETWKITSFYNVNHSIDSILDDIDSLPEIDDLRFFHYTTIENISKFLDAMPLKCRNVIDHDNSIKKLLEEAKKIVTMPYGYSYNLSINWNDKNTFLSNYKTEYGLVYNINIGESNTAYTVQHKFNSDVVLCPNQTLCIYTKNYNWSYCACYVINSIVEECIQLKEVPLNDGWTAFYLPLDKVDYLKENFLNYEHCLQFGFSEKGISENNFLVSAINSVNIIPADIDDQMNKLPDQLPGSLNDLQVKILKGANFLYDAVTQKSFVKSASKLQEYNNKFNIEW